MINHNCLCYTIGGCSLYAKKNRCEKHIAEVEEFLCWIKKQLLALLSGDIEKKTPARCYLLYDSYAKGNAHEDSDIDTVVICNGPGWIETFSAL